MNVQSDFLIIGSGIAGLSFALKAAEHGSVTIVTKRTADESGTKYAQGGIASALGEDDSYALHIEDTLKAGGGICRENAVRVMVEGGPDSIKELMGLGAQFSSENSDSSALALGKEGGHSKRRIVHACDFTGMEVIRALVTAAQKHNRITVLEDHIAIDLITKSKFDNKTDMGNPHDAAFGAYVLDIKSGNIKKLLSKITFLATGGAGKAYLYTSNPDTATGDGIAMAHRAGAKIANMEFIQFHPTCLYNPEAKSFLVSEALRGEGATLRLRDGTAFMEKYHDMGCLAPRDVVARAIDSEMKKSGDDCVFLDITNLEVFHIQKRFPNIYKKCLSFGLDIAKEWIPVVPAAHYVCGGVQVDIEGRTSIKNLYAGGESAWTGVHGANRLASNSLLEALVFSNRAAKHAQQKITDISFPTSKIPNWDIGDAVNSDESVVVSHNWDEIRRTMSNYVGIVRSDKRLTRAKRRIELLQEEIKEYYWNFLITSDLIELRNIATVSELIISAAMSRKESRGLHHNLDYPERNDALFKKDTIITGLIKGITYEVE